MKSDRSIIGAPGWSPRKNFFGPRPKFYWKCPFLQHLVTTPMCSIRQELCDIVNRYIMSVNLWMSTGKKKTKETEG